MKTKPLITNPTGKPIRADEGGSGKYGASRVRINRKGDLVRYAHRGTDFICTPGQKVRAPIGGILVREARPYAHGGYSGVLIVGKKGKCKMFYLSPDKTLIGTAIQEGQPIGRAQDISKKYPVVMPHIHLEFLEFNPETLLKGE